MAKTKNYTIYYIIGAAIIIYLYKKNKGALNNLLPGGGGGGGSTSGAAMAAKQLASDAIQNTTFTPVFKTDEQQYQESLNNCK